MSPADIIAKLTGLEGKITALETANASASANLQTEISARTALETKLTASDALVQAQAAKIKELEIKAAAPAPEPDPDEEKGKSDAQGMLEAVLEFIKGLLPKADDADAKADDDADAADDTEAKALLAKGKKAAALAVRAKTVQRKVTALKAKTIPVAALPKEVAKQIAAMGIPAALALNKTGATGDGTPLAEARAKAKDDWFKNIR